MTILNESLFTICISMKNQKSRYLCWQTNFFKLLNGFLFDKPFGNIYKNIETANIKLLKYKSLHYHH